MASSRPSAALCLPISRLPFGDTISVDTKHVIAWVMENNPKAYVDERFDKTKQPIRGDPDCKLGLQRSATTRAKATATTPPLRLPAPLRLLQPPLTSPIPCPPAKSRLASSTGAMAPASSPPRSLTGAKIVPAELTRSFDHADPTYFFPLLEETERRLGRKLPLRRPRQGLRLPSMCIRCAVLRRNKFESQDSVGEGA